MDFKKAIELLELDKDYSDEDLQKSYKNLAKKYHPDNSVTGDEDKFISIKEAYDFLSDPNNKKDEKSGLYNEQEEAICPMCDGKGWRREKIKTSRGYVAQKVKCSFCDGNGRK